MSRSKLFDQIRKKVFRNNLKVFRVKDVQSILTKSPSFLSKHCEGNPGEHTAYFKKICKGLYSLNTNVKVT